MSKSTCFAPVPIEPLGEYVDLRGSVSMPPARFLGEGRHQLAQHPVGDYGASQVMSPPPPPDMPDWRKIKGRPRFVVVAVAGD